MSIQIAGFSDSVKIPGFFAETVYNAGAITAGSIPLLLLLCGTMTTGTATANRDVVPIYASGDADAAFGQGSELAIMCYGALQTPGVSIFAAPTPEASGSTAATATITITGAWTVGGTLGIRVDGIPIYVNALSTDTPTTFATSIAAAINAVGTLSTTAAALAGVVTLTRKSKGARGNAGALYQDTSAIPSGMTSTLAGGVAMTGPGVHFTGGTGHDSVTTILSTVIPSKQYDRIVPAQTDATNVEAWATFVNGQAAPLVGILEHLVFGTTGGNDAGTSFSFANAVTLAQTTLNAERAQLLWMNDGETIPSFMAAAFGAIRTSVEQGDPDAAYDGTVLPGVAPQSQMPDWPNTSTLIAALNSGVTPVTTNASMQANVVRSITTFSLDQFGNPDYTTLDTSEAVVPDYVRTTLRLYYLTVAKPNNPRTGPDPAVTARSAPAGFLTPNGWTQQATQQQTLLEQTAPPILLPGSTAANPIVSEWDEDGQRIQAVSPVVPCPNNHQIGVSVRNVTSV